MVYLAALVWPDFKGLPNIETVVLDIGTLIGGEWTVGLRPVEYFVVPTFGFTVCAFLGLNLASNPKLAGFGRLVVGVMYLLVLTRRFRLAPASLESLEVHADAD